MAVYHYYVITTSYDVISSFWPAIWIPWYHVYIHWQYIYSPYKQQLRSEMQGLKIWIGGHFGISLITSDTCHGYVMSRHVIYYMRRIKCAQCGWLMNLKSNLGVVWSKSVIFVTIYHYYVITTSYDVISSFWHVIWIPWYHVYIHW